MVDLQMPEPRQFDWGLKPNSTTHFGIYPRSNGQFCVVLNHSLIRGCTAEMIHWWFLNFPNLRVKLVDIVGYENQQVPAYLLWHPTDHLDATLKGKLGTGGTSRAGALIHIREAMQYPKVGWKYKVDNTLKIFYCESDGWAMGREIPLLGKAMLLRIHFVDVVEYGIHLGVHYHYEIVVGLSGNSFITQQLNKRITREFSTEFFEAWHTHNVIEVGVFENFLPALFKQRDNLEILQYAKDMAPELAPASTEGGFDHTLFNQRLEGYKTCKDPYEFQHPQGPTFLTSLG